MLSPWLGKLGQPNWGVRRGSEESLSGDTGKALIPFILRSLLGGRKHNPWGLVLLFPALCEGGLQSQGCGSLANQILSRTLCCRHAIYCQAGPKYAQTWGVKWGHIAPLPIYLNTFPFIYTDTLHKCVILMGLRGNTENNLYLRLNCSVKQKEKKEEGKKNTLLLEWKQIIRASWERDIASWQS